MIIPDAGFGSWNKGEDELLLRMGMDENLSAPRFQVCVVSLQLGCRKQKVLPLCNGSTTLLRPLAAVETVSQSCRNPRLPVARRHRAIILYFFFCGFLTSF